MKGFIEVSTASYGTLLVNIRQISHIQQGIKDCIIYLNYISNRGSGMIIYTNQTYEEVKALIEAAE